MDRQKTYLFKLKFRYQIVGEPEIQKLEKSGRKVAEFLTISSVSMVFQKCENRYCTNFKSCKKMFIYGVIIFTLMQALCSRLFATLLKRKII